MGHEERLPLPRRVAAIGSVKGRSPEYPVTTGKRRFQTFAGLLSNREVLPKAGLRVRPGLPVGADAHRKHGRGPQDADGGGSRI